ncbi:MAG: tRNA pseudouridine(13) synthase TruD [Crenarchaeota archaeon]|nr:tRNA pseudouridine(13) synthase TruD [Thermoproteota archaeon]
MIHPIDAYVGMKKYFMNVGLSCSARVPRPEGFKVVELSEPSKGPWPIYALYKKNIDTHHAVSILEKRFGGRWKWLGLKDKSAVTAQLVSSDVGVEGYAVEGRGWCLRLEPLGRGALTRASLHGNLFVIDVEAECRASITTGSYLIPGYFSYQRFGTTRPITHVVGKFILKGEWEEAVNVLLGEPTPWESPLSRSVRLRYYAEGPRAFLDAPKWLDIERRVAIALLRGRGPERALKSLRVFKLFLHAYQAYLYNKMLSEAEDPCEGPTRLPGPGAEEYRDVLDEEGIELSSFNRYGLRAEPRRPCARINVKVYERENGFTLIFSLPKGYYATSFLREMIRNPFAL